MSLLMTVWVGFFFVLHSFTKPIPDVMEIKNRKFRNSAIYILVSGVIEKNYAASNTCAICSSRSLTYE